MATLHRHNGIVSIHLRNRGLTQLTRYAIATDGTVLWHNGFGWKISKLSQASVAALPVDTSATAKAIISRANADAHAHDAAVSRRRRAAPKIVPDDVKSGSAAHLNALSKFFGI